MGRVRFFKRMVREGVTEKVTVEQRYEEMMNASQVCTWGENLPGRGKVKSRGFESGVCLRWYYRNSQAPRVVEVKRRRRARGDAAGDGAREPVSQKSPGRTPVREMEGSWRFLT